ncbi:MAG: 7TM-DISM domain-containing protein [Cyclobacteriaceae bacterium]
MSAHKFTFLGLALLLTLTNFAQEGKPIGGVLDLRSWDFTASPKISLDGEWKFYWNELLTQQEAQKKPETFLVSFSIPWNEQQGRQLPAEGYATYTLQIYLPKNAPKLVVEVPPFYNSYQLSINENIVAENGKVGINKNSSIPYWRTTLNEIKSDTDTLNLILHISNFHHSRGGANMPIHLGTSDSLHNSFTISDWVIKTLCVALLIMSLFFLFYSRNKKTALYFSAVCFSWLVRVLFSSNYFFHDFVEVPWVWAVRLEYFSFISTAIFGALYIGSLYRQDSPVILKYFLVIVNTAFIFLILISSPATFTEFVWLYLAVALLTVVFALFVVLRALVYDRAGVGFSVVGFIFLAAMFGYNIIAYLENFDVNTIIFYGGFLIAFVLQGYAMHYRTTHPDKSDILTMEDLYGKKLN